jgi:hypothetical protein
MARRMVDPDKRSLMIVYDDMQAIYKGRARPVWSQLGIEAEGRTTVLKINYRNTAQILGLRGASRPMCSARPACRRTMKARC